MNAAILCGSVNVIYNSSAVVLNSSFEVTVVVLVMELPVFDVLDEDDIGFLSF